MKDSNVLKSAMKCAALNVHGRCAPRSPDLEHLPTLGNSSKQAIKQLKGKLYCAVPYGTVSGSLIHCCAGPNSVL